MEKNEGINDKLILNRQLDDPSQSKQVVAIPARKLDEWIANDTEIISVEIDGKLVEKVKITGISGQEVDIVSPKETLEIERVADGDKIVFQIDTVEKDGENHDGIPKQIYEQDVAGGSLELLSIVIMPNQTATIDLNLFLDVPNSDFGFEVNSNIRSIQKPDYAEDYKAPTELTVSARYRHTTTFNPKIISFEINKFDAEPFQILAQSGIIVWIKGRSNVIKDVVFPYGDLSSTGWNESSGNTINAVDEVLDVNSNLSATGWNTASGNIITADANNLLHILGNL